MERICIIIPVYNGETVIKRCLDSIFSQSYKEIVVVCINDGSTDKTLSVLQNYKKKNLYVIDQENKGVSAARNAGLDFAEKQVKYDYITFIDSDDYIDSNYLQTMVDMMHANDVEIVCVSFNFQASTYCRPYNQIGIDKKFSCFEGTKILVEDKTVQSHSHCKLYKRNVWNNVRFPVGIAWMEDQAILFLVFYNAKKGIFISNYHGYHYWQEGSSACRSQISNKRIIDSLIGYKKACDYNFSDFSDDEQNEIKKVANNALADVYLMTFFKIQAKKLTVDQKKTFIEIKKYIKNNRIVKKYIPENKNSRLKRLAYLYMRPFYKILFKIFS